MKDSVKFHCEICEDAFGSVSAEYGECGTGLLYSYEVLDKKGEPLTACKVCERYTIQEHLADKADYIDVCADCASPEHIHKLTIKLRIYSVVFLLLFIFFIVFLIVFFVHHS